MDDPYYRIVYNDDQWGCGGWIAAVMLVGGAVMWVIVQLGNAVPAVR